MSFTPGIGVLPVSAAVTQYDSIIALRMKDFASGRSGVSIITNPVSSIGQGLSDNQVASTFDSALETSVRIQAADIGAKPGHYYTPCISYRVFGGSGDPKAYVVGYSLEGDNPNYHW